MEGVDFRTIGYFRQRLETLKTVRRGVYSTAEDEIRQEFSRKGIEEIRINNDMVLIEGDTVVIKLRLPDRKHRLSKRDGYRLIYLVSKVKPVVAFLDIYPKNGPMQQLDETDAELKNLVMLFVQEAQQGLLEDFNM